MTETIATATLTPRRGGVLIPAASVRVGDTILVAHRPESRRGVSLYELGETKIVHVERSGPTVRLFGSGKHVRLFNAYLVEATHLAPRDPEDELSRAFYRDAPISLLAAGDIVVVPKSIAEQSFGQVGGPPQFARVHSVKHLACWPDNAQRYTVTLEHDGVKATIEDAEGHVCLPKQFPILDWPLCTTSPAYREHLEKTTGLKRYVGPLDNPLAKQAGSLERRIAEDALADAVETRKAVEALRDRAKARHEKAKEKLQRAQEKEELARTHLAEEEAHYQRRIDEESRLGTELDKIEVKGKLVVPQEPARSDQLTLVQFEVGDGKGQFEPRFLRRLGGNDRWTRLDGQGRSCFVKSWDEHVEHIVNTSSDPQRALDSAKIVIGEGI